MTMLQPMGRKQSVLYHFWVRPLKRTLVALYSLPPLLRGWEIAAAGAVASASKLELHTETGRIDRGLDGHITED